MDVLAILRKVGLIVFRALLKVAVGDNMEFLSYRPALSDLGALIL